VQLGLKEVIGQHLRNILDAVSGRGEEAGSLLGALVNCESDAAVGLKNVLACSDGRRAWLQKLDGEG